MANSHGGARKGAGRRAGVAAKRSAEARERIFKDGVTPMDVMNARMAQEPVVISGEPKIVTDEMFAAAVALAPYVHPRLSQIEAKVDTNVTQYVIAGVPESASEDAWVTQHQNMH